MSECTFASEYGGQWIDGIFQRWVDINELDFLSNTHTKALIVNKRTGKVEFVSPRLIRFNLEDMKCDNTNR